MSQLSTATNAAALLDDAMIRGDLSKMNDAQRLQFYGKVCESLGLNPLTCPLEYLQLNGKLRLYARKDCTDQLRRIHNVSIGKPEINLGEPDWIVVTVVASTPDGRTDSDIGVVGRKDMQGNFGNCLMKAITKAKRRVTLSLCGLGILDESEVDSIPDAKPVPVPTVADKPEQKPANGAKPQPQRRHDPAAFAAWLRQEDEHLASKGVIQPGDLKAHVVAACPSKGPPNNVAYWTDEVIDKASPVAEAFIRVSLEPLLVQIRQIHGKLPSMPAQQNVWLPWLEFAGAVTDEAEQIEEPTSPDQAVSRILPLVSAGQLQQIWQRVCAPEKVKASA